MNVVSHYDTVDVQMVIGSVPFLYFQIICDRDSSDGLKRSRVFILLVTIGSFCFYVFPENVLFLSKFYFSFVNDFIVLYDMTLCLV